MFLSSAARALWRNPGFAVTALATLSLGIATVSALFSVVDKVLLEPLPYPDPGRLVQLITTSNVGEQKLSSIPEFLFWRDTTTSFESLAASDVDAPEISLSLEQRSIPLKAARVSSQYFPMFGARFVLGNSFSALEDTPQGPKVAILSAGTWQRFFRSDSTIVGRVIILNDQPCQVAGVLAPGARLESTADIWLPLRADRRSVDHLGRVRVIGRLRRDVTLAGAQHEIGASLGAFLRRYPPYSQSGAPVLHGEAFQAIPLRDAVVGDVRPALYLMMGAVGFVLAISATNTATLLLARAGRRTRETAIRIAVGAARRQVLLQYMAESLLLAVAAGAAGLALGHFGVRAFLAVSPADLPRIGANGSAIALDGRVILFTVAVSAVLAVGCSLVPALPLVNSGMAHAARDSRRQRWRAMLTAAEMAVSLVLLTGAGMMIRTLVAQRAIDRGFDERNVLTVEMALNHPRFHTAAAVADLVRHGERRLSAIPGVVTVAVTGTLPLVAGLPMPFTILKNDHFLLGRYDGTATWRSVSPGYFRAFQIRLLRGRVFTEDDDENAAGVVVLNRAMVRQYWQEADANPIGEFITIGKDLDPEAGDTPRQVIGVVADIRDAGLDREPSFYVPVAQVSDWMNARNNRLQPLVWTVRTDGFQPAVVARIPHELAALSGGQAVGRVRTMHEAIAASSARTQFYMTLLSVFAAVAVLLTAAGLYGLMAFSVQQRRRELAIRAALGATPRDVQGMVVMQALRLTLLGTLAGVPLAVALNRVTIGLIFGIRSWDPLVFALVPLALGAVSLLAAYAPSVSASRVNPAGALRAEG